MKMSIKGVSGRVFTKNQRIFQELCGVKSDRFFNRLMEIRKLFGLPRIKEIHMAMQVIGDKPTQKEWDELTNLIAVCAKNSNQFLASLNVDTLNSFQELIDHILVDNKLGTEWRYSLIDVVLSGFFMPPIYNLRIETDTKNKTLSLKLNPDTSIDDIKSAWSLVESEQQKMFGKVSRKNLTDKSVENLITQVKIKEIQRKHPELKGTGILGELVDDSEAFDREADRKAANNLRQIKSRLNRQV